MDASKLYPLPINLQTQSVFRAYRLGQKKPCYIYRFIASGTMEEVIYKKQIEKEATALRVIDEQQIDRHFKQGELMELYDVSKINSGASPDYDRPQDEVLAELLDNHSRIYKYHEHGALLSNINQESLTVDEMENAWSNYESNQPTTSKNHLNRFKSLFRKCHTIIIIGC